MATKPPPTDIDDLLDFADSEDRSLSILFVGRESELADFDRRSRRVMERWCEGGPVAGRTVIVTGCPGMGKTSLLEHFARSSCNKESDPDAPAAVWLGIEELRREEDVGEALRTAALDMPWWSEAFAPLLDDAGKWTKLASIFDAIKRLTADAVSKMRPVCLLVDEIQNADMRNADVLRVLHEGRRNLPILPIFAGLNDAPDALKRIGISRLASRNTVSLGRLSQEDVRNGVLKFFREFHVAGDDDEKERWTTAIVEDSLGFPQHLHVGLQEAARVLAEQEGVVTAAGLGAARKAAEAARKAYYRSRLSPELEERSDTLLTLVRLVAGGNEPLSTKRLVQAALVHMRTQSDDYGTPTWEDARQFVRAAIHDGVFQTASEPGDGYQVPIPSMQTWLLDEYARETGWDRPPPPARGDLPR